ncbi:MAG: hypothetical protein FWH36_06185 [Lentimicrobiaceae bacterium]|nr:hypothetical protein [Lentimicrobiaceae bacterium]
MKKITFLSIMLVLMVAFVGCNPDPVDPPNPPEPDTLIRDGDGNIYTEITIGEQTWLKENLKTTKYNDGTPLVNAVENAAWASNTSGAYCWYNNSESNKNTYGALYNFQATIGGKICPKGWHVSFNREWDDLIYGLGGAANAGGALKEEGVAHWEVGAGATNESGFTALPNGQRLSDGTFEKLRSTAVFWSQDAISPLEATFYYLQADLNSVIRESTKKECGFAIRCVKD